MTLLANNDIVPVLTYHSVGMHEPSWTWSQLSERADAFDKLLRALHKRGYRTVTLAELYAHMAGEKTCPPRSIVLVFDDGYLDNWVTVQPLLKRYGMTGTVYVNPDFVEPGGAPRPTLDDYPGEWPGGAEVRQSGFMNWAELAELDRSGVLDVQSHSLTHTWYFTSPTVEDFYSPSNAARYPWMAWNARPERKPYYLTEDQSEFVAWGTPVFEHEKSLIARRFIPDASAVDAVASAVADRGGADFFKGEGWRHQLEKTVADLTGGIDFPGTFESDADYESRVRDELGGSKSIIERKLGKTVDFLCWPGGGVNDTAKRIATEVGYRSWTLPSSAKPSKRNRPGSDPREIKRLPALREVLFFGRNWGVGSERLVLLEILAHQESKVFDLARKAYKVGVAAGIAGQGR